MAAGGKTRGHEPQKTDPMKAPTTQSDVRKVTAQGCLERDYLYRPGGTTTGSTTTTGTTTTGTARSTGNVVAPTPYKLTQAQIIKDESMSTSGYATNPAAPAGTTTLKDVDLHVAPA